MKLPAETMSSQEQAVVPEQNGHVEDPRDGSNDNSTNGESTDSEVSPRTPTNNAGNVQPDFSEYLWMENEEEFDEEMMRQIEEDYMISHYSDMFENSLLEDGAPGPTTASLCVVSGSFLPPFPEPVGSSEDDLDNVTRQFNRTMTFSSRLNPDAQEFVPKGFSDVSPH